MKKRIYECGCRRKTATVKIRNGRVKFGEGMDDNQDTVYTFWNTQAAPVLQKAGLPSYYESCINFLPEGLKDPFIRLWNGGALNSLAVLSILYNGWARYASRLDNELDLQTARRWVREVSPNVDSARSEFVSGVMTNIEKAVREAEAEKERKRKLRENTRLVRLGVDDIRTLLELIGERTGACGRIRETLVKSLERRKSDGGQNED